MTRLAVKRKSSKTAAPKQSEIDSAPIHKQPVLLSKHDKIMLKNEGKFVEIPRFKLGSYVVNKKPINVFAGTFKVGTIFYVVDVHPIRGYKLAFDQYRITQDNVTIRDVIYLDNITDQGNFEQYQKPKKAKVTKR